MHRPHRRIAGLLLLLTAAVPLAAAAPTTIPRDHYRAAGDLDLRAEVLGDLVIAGLWTRFDGRVAGDLLAAAGRAELHGHYEDDVRVAGGQIRLGGTVADEAMLAGLDVTLDREADIGGRTWIGGGQVRIDGRVRGALRIAAREVILAGRIEGPVRVRADSLRILPGARITGDVVYRAPAPATIAPGAEVGGPLTHHRVPRGGPAGGAPAGDGGPRVAGVLIQVLALLLPGVLLRLGLPGLLAEGHRTLVREPLLSLGIGGLVLIVGPLVALGLCLFVITIPLSLAALLLALPIGLAGYLVAAGTVAERALARLVPARGGQLAAHALALAAVLLALTLLQALPIAGVLVLAATTLFGTGAAAVAVRRRLRPAPAPGSGPDGGT